MKFKILLAGLPFFIAESQALPGHTMPGKAGHGHGHGHGSDVQQNLEECPDLTINSTGYFDQIFKDSRLSYMNKKNQLNVYKVTLIGKLSKNIRGGEDKLPDKGIIVNYNIKDPINCYYRYDTTIKTNDKIKDLAKMKKNCDENRVCFSLPRKGKPFDPSKHLNR